MDNESKVVSIPASKEIIPGRFSSGKSPRTGLKPMSTKRDIEKQSLHVLPLGFHRLERSERKGVTSTAAGMVVVRREVSEDDRGMTRALLRSRLKLKLRRSEAGSGCRVRPAAGPTLSETEFKADSVKKFYDT